MREAQFCLTVVDVMISGRGGSISAWSTGADSMWYLIIECPIRTHPPETSAVGVAPTEDPFLDFDPILPGWPPPPPPGECAAGESLAGPQAIPERS